MKDIEQIKKEAEKKLNAINTQEELDAFLIEYFGRKSGVLNNILKSLKDLSIEEKKEVGKKANQLKEFLQKKAEEKKQVIFQNKIKIQEEKEKIDITAPSKYHKTGGLHPLDYINQKAVSIFESMGFEVVEGPEVENEFYNFDALNIPKHHPARDMQDTFWLDVDSLLLRTQTSAVQVRYMQKNLPPLRIVSPGRVFRRESTDATHEMQFYQIECLVVGKDISLANLKSLLEFFFSGLLEKSQVKVRFRPSYFPFVEPGVEVDVSCFLCRQKGCSVCKNTGWIEVGGAGLVHPNVLETAKISSRDFSGLAFGMGLDRIAMIKYNIDDVRLFYSSDLRFIKQFSK